MSVHETLQVFIDRFSGESSLNRKSTLFRTTFLSVQTPTRSVFARLLMKKDLFGSHICGRALISPYFSLLLGSLCHKFSRAGWESNGIPSLSFRQSVLRTMYYP